MSTKRPSVTIISEIIQKYVGSDWDQIKGLAQELDAISEIISKSEELDAAIAAANSIVLEGTEGFVSEPLLDYTVDYTAEGFTENTLGSIITALALLTKDNEQGLVDFTTSLADALTSSGTVHSPLVGGYDPSWTNVEAILGGLPTIFTQSGTIVVADEATQTTPFEYSTGAPANLPNDGLRDNPLDPPPFTDNSLAPNNISAFYSLLNDEIDLNEFKVGDIITLRVDLEVNADSNDTDIEVLLSLAEGSPSAKVSSFIQRRLPNSATTYNVSGEITFNISHINLINNPGHIQFDGSSDADIVVNSFEAFIHAKN